VSNNWWEGWQYSLFQWERVEGRMVYYLPEWRGGQMDYLRAKDWWHQQ
jgi:hypothetical protein